MTTTLPASKAFEERAGGSEDTRIIAPDGRSLSLEYFAEWGGPSVLKLVKRAIDLLGTNLAGLRVLEIGYGHGRMSCLFALLGAQVTAVDTHDVALNDAIAEAKRWDVVQRIQFCIYSGDPRDIPQTDFDIAFTKSVLLLIPELEKFLHSLATRLRSHGQIAFVENGFHNPVAVLVRRLGHCARHNQDGYYPGVRMYDWHRPAYLSPARLAVIRKVFDVRRVLRAESPHWYLIHGLKRTQ